MGRQKGILTILAVLVVGSAVFVAVYDSGNYGTEKTQPSINIDNQSVTNEIYVDFELPGQTNGFVVLQENGTIVAHSSYLDYPPDAHVDQYPIAVPSELNGSFTVTAAIYKDTNGNEQFDPGIDTLWVKDTALIHARSQD